MANQTPCQPASRIDLVDLACGCVAGTLGSSTGGRTAIAGYRAIPAGSARRAAASCGGDGPCRRRTPQRKRSSRSYFYKLLDRGEILSHGVGRDRRIRVRDLVEFQARHNRDQRELAERFAHQQKTTAAAEAEITDLL